MLVATHLLTFNNFGHQLTDVMMLVTHWLTFNMIGHKLTDLKHDWSPTDWPDDVGDSLMTQHDTLDELNW